jgi:hypothetical protein
MSISTDASNRLTIALTSPAASAEVVAALNTSAGATTLTGDLASTSLNKGASLVGVRDAGTLFVATNVETALAEVKALADTATAVHKIALSASAAVSHVITVTAQLKDLNGNSIAAAKHCLVRTLAATDNKGDISNITLGVEEKTVNPAAGENVSWILSSASGAFTFDVTDSATESCLVQVTTEDGISALLRLSFP